MADEDFALDELDPPALSTPLDLPLPIVQLPLIEVGALAIFGLELMLAHNAFRRDSWWQPWFVPAGIAVGLIVLLSSTIRPQKRRLLPWLPVILRHLLMWLVVKLVLRPSPVRRVIKVTEHASSSTMSWQMRNRVQRAGRRTTLARLGLTIMLPARFGRWIMANVSVDEDGVQDTSGVGPRWLRWVTALANGHEPLVALLHVSDTGNLSLLDAAGRAGVHKARMELLSRPPHRFSLYHRVRPFPVEELQRASGPVASSPDLLTWAQTLVRRQLLMAVPAARRQLLERRITGMLGISADDDHGLLKRAGLAGRRLSEAEVEDLGDEAWGPEWSPAVGISITRLEVQTGADDPPPIGDGPEQPAPGNPGVRRYRTYALKGLPASVFVGWTEPLTGRRIQADLAIHVTPITDSWAETWLSFKSAWWGSMRFGRDRYTRARLQTERTLALLRRRETKVLDVGIYVSVPDTQSLVTEEALNEMVHSENVMLPVFDQLAARVATEPTGRDPLHKTWWTDSDTIAAAWPGSGGIWVDGCTLVGESARSKEPVGVNLWWEGDETSVMVVLGRSGSGKTNLVQGFCGRMMQPHPEHWLARRPPPLVVAYMKSYREWEGYCQHFGGSHYQLTDGDWRDALKAAPTDARVVAFNLHGLPKEEQVAFMEALNPWVLSTHGTRKYPKLYVIGEAWAWCQDPRLAPKLKELALTVRGEGIGLIIDTQFVQHLLESEAKDVLGAASVWCAMRLKTRERAILEEELDIGTNGMRFLAQIAQPSTLTGAVQTIKGQGIIEAHGVRTTFRMKRFGFEAPLLDQTDPRRWGIREMQGADVDDEEDNEVIGLALAGGMLAANA